MALKLPVYLDNHSTTRVDPRVVEAMVPCFTEIYGNASSKHHEFGWTAEAAVEHSRRNIAHLIGADSEEIIFTSGATESINLALKGVAEANSKRGRHIVTSVTEHRAVLDTCKRLEEYGFNVTYLPVDSTGLIDPDDVQRAITSKTVLVTIMMANNEIGTVAPIGEIGRICHESGVLFHTDATQGFGKIPIHVSELNLDLMSFNAHKTYGPKGVGALYIKNSRPRVKLAAQIDGGGHERGLRSGTLNVPAIVGFGKVASLADEEMGTEAVTMSKLRDKLENGILSVLEEVTVNGNVRSRLSHNSNLTFRGVKADQLMMEMQDIAVSTGSACSSASPEPSHVLRAIGLSDEDVHSSIRFGLGRFTTEEEIEYTIHRVVHTVRMIREKSMAFAHS